MNKLPKRAAKIGVLGNTFLFILKLVVGLLTNSLAVISDAIHSFTDIITSIVTLFCVKFSSKKADHDHPFGHSRAEPIAGIVIAIVSFGLGLDIIYLSIKRIITGEFPAIGFLPIIALAITLVIKAIMGLYFKKVNKKTQSPAIKAQMIDCRNDMMVSALALIGVIGSYLKYPVLDSVAALFVAIFVIKAGYKLGKENVNYLVGKAPPLYILQKIKDCATSIKGVKGIHDLKAHYVGHKVHVEVHIEVDKKLTTKRSHTISKKVQNKIEKMDIVTRAFIHVDPV